MTVFYFKELYQVRQADVQAGAVGRRGSAADPELRGDAEDRARARPDHGLPPAAGEPHPTGRGPRQDEVQRLRGHRGRGGGRQAAQGGTQAVRHRPHHRQDRRLHPDHRNGTCLK